MSLDLRIDALQSTSNRQGSEAGELKWLDGKAGETLDNRTPDEYLLVRFEVAREQARKDLPLSTYTEAYRKIDGHNLLHFLQLCMARHAQAGIQTYSNTIAKIVKSLL